ncbi:MAG: hypothetical protein WD877_01300 [Candidatus Saccharimonadales bacterium]
MISTSGSLIDAVAHSHTPPVLGKGRDVVERTAHVASAHVPVDGDDIAASGRASLVIRPFVEGVPVPTARVKLGGDIPVPDLRAAAPVAGHAVNPRAASRDVDAILRRSVVGVAEGAAPG